MASSVGFRQRPCSPALFANALGWRRVEAEKHQLLQDRLVFAARIDREPAGGVRMQDFQTAQLAANDRGWTTRGTTEERAGEPTPTMRPTCATGTTGRYARNVALRLDPDGEAPTLDALADALQEPARPLFIGPQALPALAPLFARVQRRGYRLDALLAWPLAEGSVTSRPLRLLWPEGEGAAGLKPNRRYMITDNANGYPASTAAGGRSAKASRSGTGFRFSLPRRPQRHREKDVQK